MMQACWFSNESTMIHVQPCPPQQLRFQEQSYSHPILHYSPHLQYYSLLHPAVGMNILLLKEIEHPYNFCFFGFISHFAVCLRFHCSCKQKLRHNIPVSNFEIEAVQMFLELQMCLFIFLCLFIIFFWDGNGFHTDDAYITMVMVAAPNDLTQNKHNNL